MMSPTAPMIRAEDLVVGEVGHREVQPVGVGDVGAALAAVVEAFEVGPQLVVDGVAGDVAGGQLGGQRLEQPPRLQQLLVGRAGELEVQRQGAGQVRRLGPAHDRTAARDRGGC